mmetsp:Transcript_85117/g.170307  ORF Transcript_85117/g.170307 Transcript_85117/m.170307 type:complete len:159 (-) Transcript_85117:204-680(-)
MALADWSCTATTSIALRTWFGAASTAAATVSQPDHHQQQQQQQQQHQGPLSPRISPLRQRPPLAQTEPAASAANHGSQRGEVDEENNQPYYSGGDGRGAYASTSSPKKMGGRSGAIGVGTGGAHAQATMNQGNSILGRRSTKVHAPPGGHSSFSIGGN